MRTCIAILLTAAACSACSGDAPRPTTPIANASTAASTAGPPTGEVRLHLGADYPEEPVFHFPLTVSYPGGSAIVADGGEHRITVPANDDELTRIVLQGWPVWVRVPVGGSTRLTSHPCCGLGFDNNSYDDEIATCAPAGGECPVERDELHPAIADDELCGDRERCVPRSKLRIVQRRPGGAESIVTEDGDVFRADEAEAIVFANVSHVFTFDVGTVRQSVAMDRATTYTIFLDGDQVTRVRATRW